jgi:hypothetical protein
VSSSAAVAPSAFDQIDRDLVGGAPYRMPHFEYLNRSNRSEADRVRTLVDAFLSRYPEVGQGRICDRLRSVDDIAHLGAFFELAVHELLVRAGCRAVAVEPPVDGTQKAPDFLVETPSGDRIYFEATLATGRSLEDVAAQRRLDQAFKAIDSIPSPDFSLYVSTSGNTDSDDHGQEVEAKASAMAREPRLRRGKHRLAQGRYRSRPGVRLRGAFGSLPHLTCAAATLARLNCPNRVHRRPHA